MTTKKTNAPTADAVAQHAIEPEDVNAFVLEKAAEVQAVEAKAAPQTPEVCYTVDDFIQQYQIFNVPQELVIVALSEVKAPISIREAKELVTKFAEKEVKKEG